MQVELPYGDWLRVAAALRAQTHLDRRMDDVRASVEAQAFAAYVKWGELVPERRYRVEVRWPASVSKIQAIKNVRTLTCLGLKDAKDIVDSWSASRGSFPWHDLGVVSTDRIVGNSVMHLEMRFTELP
jgi:hypothetical protein